MHLIDYLILFITALIGGGLYFLINAHKTVHVKLVLAFSGAYLFAVSVLHLIPEVYSTTGNSAGIFILIGFLLQIILEFFSEGIEHGHVHVHHHHENNTKFPWVMMLSLSIHSFLEGMPLASTMHEAHGWWQNPLLWGIVLHNLPISYALASMLLLSGINKTRAFVWLVVFASMAPLGEAFSHLLSIGFINDSALFYNGVMAIVIGIFLHISTTILFESSENHRFNFIKLLVIIIGGIFAYLVEQFSL